MQKILSIFNSSSVPKAFLLCLVFLIATEIVVSRNVNRLRSMSDSTIEYKSYLLNGGDRGHYDAVVFGDSRILSLNAAYISEHVSENLGRKFTLYNFAMPNHGIRTYYLILKKYLENHPAPQYILFSSAYVNLSGDWSEKSTEGRSETLHRLSQIYSLKELREVLPLKIYMLNLSVKAERLSYLVLYRGVIKKAIRDFYKDLLKRDLAGPKPYFTDTMLNAIRSCKRYNGGVIFTRNRTVTPEEIRGNKYYDWTLPVDKDIDGWYRKFFELARTHKIKVLLLNAPVYDEIYRNNQSNGTERIYLNVVEGWQEQYENVEVLGPLLQPYSIENFGDWQHLNVPGTRKFTFSVTDDLIAYLKQNQ